MTVVLRLRSTQPRRRVLAIDVIDTGIGIPADKLEAMFEPFTQAEASTTRRFGGTGLGLTISRRFARALGGDIVVHSEIGKGSMFRVTLDPGPLAGVRMLEPGSAGRGRRSARRSRTRRHGSSRRPGAGGGRRRDNRELVRLVLERSGLRVSEAENGAGRRSSTWRARALDVMLMDMQMPVMDGFTATRLLRERGIKCRSSR